MPGPISCGLYLRKGFNVKSHLIRRVATSVLCLCAFTALSGCNPLDFEKLVKESQRKADEKWRKAIEAQQNTAAQSTQQEVPGKQRDQKPVITIEEQDQQVMASQPPIKVGDQIPVPFAKSLLEGDWKGKLEGEWRENACDDQTTIALKMTTQINESFLDHKDGIQKVEGVFSSTSRSQQANAQIFETKLNGKMDLSIGFLALTSVFSEEEARKLRQQAATAKIVTQFELSKLTSDEFKGSKGSELKKLYERQEKLEKDLDMQREIAEGKGALGPLRIDVGRNIDGSGLTGVIAGGGFAGCPIVLRSERGFRTDKLPPITREVVLARIDNPAYFYGTNYSGSGYWLDIIVKEAKEEDFFRLGEVYEAQGKRFPENPENYVRATTYYQKLADKYGDARAQANLGELYENGLGVPKNIVKARELYRLAGETRKKAVNVCTSSATTGFAKRMISKQSGVTQALEFGIGLGTGIRMKSGNSRVVSIEAINVASLDKPFVCKFMSIRIDPKVNADMVPDGHYIEGPYGNIRYEDNFINKSAATMSAAVFQELLTMLPFNNWVTV